MKSCVCARDEIDQKLKRVLTMATEAHELQQAFVLHARVYRETSVLVELLTRFSGRISVIAKGVRKAKSKTQGILQPFTPLEVVWGGRGELQTLQKIETQGAALSLEGTALFSGLYLNELLMRVLHRHDPCEAIFLAYRNTLTELDENEFNAAMLRRFEFVLLSELGYAIPLTHEAGSNNMLCDDQYYRYLPERGFLRLEVGFDPEDGDVFQGEDLLAIHADRFDTIAIQQAAKRLIRIAFQPLLGHKPLKTRELFA